MNNKSRRYALMSIIGLEKYATVVYNYIYYNLISSYRDSGKMKVAKIEGNGVIENQLVEKIQAYGYFNCTASGDGTNEITLTADGNGNATFTCQLYLTPSTSHKFLISYFIETAISNLTFTSYFISNSKTIIPNTINQFSTISADSSMLTNLNIHNITISGSLQNGDVVKVRYNIIDLTLMFGTGNEPTTLTDNRIQNLLNRGYIPYNIGEYKGTNVGEIATEPYNLCNENWESGTILNGNNYPSSSAKRTPSYISVLPSTNYTIENNAIGNSFFFEYDKDKNFIQRQDLLNYGGSKTFTSNTHYVRLVVANEVTQCCFHRTGTRTGYAEHKPSASIPFIYQGNGALNAHDTFEITSSEYVFTKNVVETDLGNYNYNGSNGVFNCDLGNIKTQTNDVIVNALCPLYVPVTRNDFVNNTPNMTMRVDNNQSTPYLYFRNTTYTSSADFKTAMTGIKLRYQLSTPQVIRIPRKHLGIVDLGSLNWTGGNQYGETQTDDLGGIIKPIPNGNTILNAYCFKYIMTYPNAGYHSTTLDKIIYQWQESVATGGRIVVLDTDFKYKTAQETKALLSGVYLFYETAEEVDDIAYKIKYENGGTITTNVREEYSNLVVNGNFENSSNWSIGNADNISYSNNVLSLKNTTTSGAVSLQNSTPYSSISGHKYLISIRYNFDANIGNNLATALNGFDVGSNKYTCDGQWHTLTLTQTSTGGTFVLYIRPTSSTGNLLQFAEFELYDITDIDENTISYYDTSKMIIRKPCEVLPNVTMEVQV